MGFMKTSEAVHAASFSSDEERWATVERRDCSADGVFYYSVRTTGVYCRPSCASRQALREIPAGSTVSYAQIAERIGAPNATRAVAQACASNTIAVAIPCHRVIRNDGGLSGYRWGVERKRALLDREATS